MATAPQAAMEMPQQGANPYEDPNTLAVYDQMRKTVSPKEFGDEMLAGASQSDPQEVAKFRAALEQIDLPPEALDQLNDMVDEILANPQNYAEIRAKYMEQGATDDILPEQFDAHFFTALNMAIDQMIAAPSGVQSFAKGGIAELKPVAKAIASYGRNGDTMLAHITPAEARMLRRKGGSGTINPETGLPEFFLKKLFKGVGKALKAVGNAVKDFAKSTVGKVVTTVALGFFLGPAAASFMGATSTAAVAAVSGFVGSAGSTLLGGGNLKDALKAGAIGGLTAGATAGISGAMSGTDAFASGSYSGAGLTPSEALKGQVDKFTNFVSGTPAPVADVTTTTARDAAAAQAAPVAPAPGSVAPPVDSFAPTSTQYGAFGEAPTGVGAPAPMAAAPAVGGTAIPANPADFGAQGPLANTSLGTVAPPVDASAATTSGNALAPSVSTAPPALDSAASGNAIAPSVGGNPMDATQFEGSLAKTAPPTDPSLWDKTKDFWDKNISPSGIQQDAAGDAIAKVQKTFPGATADQIMNAPAGSALAKAYSAAMPGMLATYGPATALGIGAIGAFGGFSPKSAPVSPYQDMLTGGPGSARDLMSKDPTRYHVQHLPGVTYYNGSVIKPLGMAEGGEVEPQYYAVGGGVIPGSSYEPTDMGGNPRIAQQKLDYLDYRDGFFSPFPAPQMQPQQMQPQVQPQQMQPQQMQPQQMQPQPQPVAPPGGIVSKGVIVGAAPDRSTLPAAQGGTLPVPAPARMGFDSNVATNGNVNDYFNLSPNMVRGADRAVASGRFSTPPANISFGSGTLAMGTSPNTGGITALSSPARAQAAAPMPVAPRATPASQNLPDLPQNTTAQAQLAAAQARAAKDYRFAMEDKKAAFLNAGGIASLASGGYPRRTGQIQGPGTETSDSIPAMLSDGEFVMTAKAVRGAGKGDRRAGAKRMYALMHQLERNAARG